MRPIWTRITKSIDDFYWMVYNTANVRLFTLDFDNLLMRVYYKVTGASSPWVSTGYEFHNEEFYDLRVSRDFAVNRWSAFLDGQLMVDQQPIAPSGTALTLGDIDAVWEPRLTLWPGNNFMVFDDYRVTAEGSQAPVIVRQPQSQTVDTGNAATFGVVADGTERLRYQWRHGGTDIVGATNAVLTLFEVVPQQAGSYSVAVTNDFGVATSDLAALTVRIPSPIRCTGAQRLPDGRFTFRVMASAGALLAVEGSENLHDWQQLGTLVATNGTAVFWDAGSAGVLTRFSRARAQP